MKRLLLSATMLSLVACSPQEQEKNEFTEGDDVAFVEQAVQIAQETIIIDTHIDVPYRLNEAWADVTVATDGGDFDYPRAVAGGLNVPFMSIYTPAAIDDQTEREKHALAMIDIVKKIIAIAPDKFAIPHSTEELAAIVESGKIALPLGMENGSPIRPDLSNLQAFYDHGIRYITLTHSLSNQFSDSSYDENRQWDGLSQDGIALVRAMNDIGIMVDVSHLSDAAFYDVMEHSVVPVIASHSSARHFTPGFERNMNDDMIKALTANGGVIMINFGSSFLTEAANNYRPRLDAAYEAYLSETGIEDSEDIRETFVERYRQDNPYPYASIDDVLDHIDHAVAIAGIDYVGIGSDYDGVGDSLPDGLKDVASYPALINGLLARGYKEPDIRKILSGNLLRVWKTVESHAAKTK